MRNILNSIFLILEFSWCDLKSKNLTKKKSWIQKFRFRILCNFWDAHIFLSGKNTLKLWTISKITQKIKVAKFIFFRTLRHNLDQKMRTALFEGGVCIFLTRTGQGRYAVQTPLPPNRAVFFYPNQTVALAFCSERMKNNF